MIKTEINNIVQSIKEEPKTFLSFLKGKFPLFHKSNIFLRDVQYGLKSYLEKKDINVPFHVIDNYSRDLINHFEKENIFQIIQKDKNWMLNYPEFVTTAPGDPL